MTPLASLFAAEIQMAPRYAPCRTNAKRCSPAGREQQQAAPAASAPPDAGCMIVCAPFQRKALRLRAARGTSGGTAMLKGMAGAIALTAALVMPLVMPLAPAAAFDETKYPDLSGQWRKPSGVGNQWGQTKPLGRAQQPPLTPEYQAVF